MVSRELYRDGMARFGAAVHVVTTDGPAGLCGLTVSAACSVTDDPPTLLFCLNRASRMHSIFQQNGVFCINTLAAEQQHIAELFSRQAGMPMAERFALPVWDRLETGSPALVEALVCFDCRILEVHEVGTHWVIFGGVQQLRTSAHARALLYLRRAYHSLEF